MRTGNLAHPIVLRLVTLLVLVCCTHAAHAGSLQDVQFPKPITSAQYEKALKTLDVAAPQRRLLETKVMDAGGTVAAPAESV